MATGTRRRRSTMALVNWVVPIITPEIVSGATFDRASTPSIAATTPAPTSAVVGALMEALTVAPSISTASVFVPPTSTPILIPVSRASCRRILVAALPDRTGKHRAAAPD